MFPLAMAKKKPTRLPAPEVCPVCGEEVPRGAVACPECGADHQSGWREDAADHDGLDLPEDPFDYEEFVASEFGSGSKRSALKPHWWITGVLLLAILIAVFFYLARF